MILGQLEGVNLKMIGKLDSVRQVTQGEFQIEHASSGKPRQQLSQPSPEYRFKLPPATNSRICCFEFQVRTIHTPNTRVLSDMNVDRTPCNTFGARGSDAISSTSAKVFCLLAIERYLAYDGSSTNSFSLHGKLLSQSDGGRISAASIWRSI